ncbi:MAG TPA: hypothetical protein VIH27_03270 [Nitrososphaerales archaeon]
MNSLVFQMFRDIFEGFMVISKNEFERREKWFFVYDEIYTFCGIRIEVDRHWCNINVILE